MSYTVIALLHVMNIGHMPFTESAGAVVSYDILTMHVLKYL